MGFMKPQIVYDRWIEVETTHGTQFLPQDLIGKTTEVTSELVKDYIEGDFLTARIIDGYGARLSAPGYIDCTQWTVFETKEEAKQHLLDAHCLGDDDRDFYDAVNEL